MQGTAEASESPESWDSITFTLILHAAGTGSRPASEPYDEEGTEMHADVMLGECEDDELKGGLTRCNDGAS